MSTSNEAGQAFESAVSVEASNTTTITVSCKGKDQQQYVALYQLELIVYATEADVAKQASIGKVSANACYCTYNPNPGFHSNRMGLCPLARYRGGLVTASRTARENASDVLVLPTTLSELPQKLRLLLPRPQSITVRLKLVSPVLARADSSEPCSVP